MDILRNIEYRGHTTNEIDKLVDYFGYEGGRNVVYNWIDNLFDKFNYRMYGVYYEKPMDSVRERTLLQNEALFAARLARAALDKRLKPQHIK